MKAVSLFSGQGGLDIGFEDAGFEILHAIEMNAYACETLRQNRQIANMSLGEFDSWFEAILRERHFMSWSDKDIRLLRNRLSKGVGMSTHFRSTNVIEGDIRKVDAGELRQLSSLRRGELDLIIGGPPCQSFSRSGKRASVSDERGQLFIDFARFVDEFRPRWFVLENVKGITLTKTNLARSVCTTCGSRSMPVFADYLSWRDDGTELNCTECNIGVLTTTEVPDVRGGAAEIIVNEFERLGYRCHVSVLNAQDFGVPQSRERFFIVGSRDGESFDFPEGEYSAQPLGQPSLFGGRKTARTVWDTLFSQPNPYHHPQIDIDSAVLWVKNVVRPHDEPVTWRLDRPAPTVGAHQGAKLAIAPFGVPEAQLARQQWHTLGKRQGDTPPVPVNHTYLSDEDLLKLQSFPDYWYVAGTRMERAFQIGNAVPPALARAVALEVALKCSVTARAA